MTPHIQKKLKYAAPMVTLKRPYEVVDRPYVGLEHIASWTGKIDLNGEATPEGTVSLFEQNDVLFGKLRPYLAKVAIGSFAGACSTEALVLRPRPGIWPPYVRYVLSERGFIDKVDASTFGAKMPRASWEFIGSQVIPTPDLDTQKTIADFLDRETYRIDQLTEKKQRLVVLLQEKDEALCTRTVTRGLHSDVTLIDSGSVWLGMVPRHWEIIRLKYLFRLLSGYAFKSEFFVKDEAEFPVLVTPGSFDPEGGLYPEMENTVRLKGEFDTRFQLVAGDIVITLTDLSYKKLILGRCEFVPRDGYLLNQRVAKVQALSKDVVRSFLRYTVNSRPTREQVILGSSGATVFHSSSEKVRDIYICLPPIAEQHEIVKFLDSRIKQSAEIKNTIRTSIERLREFRFALITAAVTGQIDMKSWSRRGATDRRLDIIAADMAAAAQPIRRRAHA